MFDRISDLENLVLSWREFRLGKKDRPDVLLFERHLEDNLWALHASLRDKTYRHHPYKSFFIRDPKVRHIHKASVRDRLLHHAIVRHLNPIFDQTFIHDSYSCRVGRGTHKGVERFVAFGRKASANFTMPCWVLKCDIKKFFATIDQQILLRILFRRITDPDTQWLLHKIVSSFQSEFSAHTERPKGVPIGNLTSQLFANVYLNEFDQFMKHELKEKYYIRYADDFVVLHPQRIHCMDIVRPIDMFLKTELKLELHPRKVIVRKFSQGVDFLGYVCFPHFRIPRLATERRIFRKIREKARLVKNGRLSAESFHQTVQSYFGILGHSNSFQLRQELENQIFFWLSE